MSTENTKEQNEQLASEVTRRIQELDSLNGESLKGEMAALKKAILENPAASALLLDEDVGKLVRNLRRITGVALAEASKPKASKAKSKVVKLSLEDELEGAAEL